MRNLFQLIGITLFVACLQWTPAGAADDFSDLYYQFTLSLEGTRLDNLSIGDDLEVDRLVTRDYELEMELEYSLRDSAYLFLNVSLIDETEEIEPLGERETESGLQRNEMGVAINFGETIPSQLKVGRIELVSSSEWWVWWDEELDAISLDSNYGPVSGMLAIAEEQARESTGADFIDPEMKDVQRVLASLSWTFAEDQSLILYYLDQQDGSSAFAEGGVADDEQLDEVDADLTWTGISYLGDFEVDAVGEIGIELHYARVGGNETLTEFEDPEGGLSEVDEIEKRRVSGSAQSYRLSWTPAGLDDWSFVVGGARGSGDSNPDDGRDESFQATGLQGDSEVFGELYQPEISNMAVQALGVTWELYPGYELALFGYDYRQLEASEDIRDVSIERDANGVDRDLGREIDLILVIGAVDNLELTLIAAEFEAGAAYGEGEGERSRYFSLEMEYRF